MFQLLNLTNIPIFEQLQIEEALLRADTGNWCLINHGSTPAIVMGISGKPEKLIDLSRARQDLIPLIKRYSGGGTVFVDENTLFVSFICNQADFEVQLHPKRILEWTQPLYEHAFEGFSVRENDYVFGEMKFGGNAQYIQRGRFCHHTSFLWDFDEQNMDYLLLPEKRPEYRQSRSHKDFLTRLKPLFPSKEQLVDALVTSFNKVYSFTPTTLAHDLLERPHRKGTVNIDLT